MPPGSDVKLNAPVLGLTGTSAMSAYAVGVFEFAISITTPVLGPGAGDTVPVIAIGCVPEYDCEAVWRVTV